jgi:hypothetical protein
LEYEINSDPMPTDKDLKKYTKSNPNSIKEQTHLKIPLLYQSTPNIDHKS